YRIIAPVIVFVATGVALGVMLSFWSTIISETGYIIMFAVILGCWIWIMMGEMRIRAIRVVVEEDHIMVREFLGLHKSRIFYYQDLDGYEIKVLEAEYGSYEYLFIMKKGKRVIRISQYYHSNYKELKFFIQKKLRQV